MENNQFPTFENFREETKANEAMVQSQVRANPQALKYLLQEWFSLWSKNKMLDSNFTSSAHCGKNQKYMIDELANFIMDNTF